MSGATRWTTFSVSGRPEASRPGTRLSRSSSRRPRRAGHERDRHESPPAPPRAREDRFETARTVADAVLYEGYVLYPYRASSRKNQVRFQWGVLTPRAYSETDGSERWSARTECLVDARRPAPSPRSSGCVSAACRPSAAGSRPACRGRGSLPPCLRSDRSTPSRWTGRPTWSGTRRSTTWSTCPLS